MTRLMAAIAALLVSASGALAQTQGGTPATTPAQGLPPARTQTPPPAERRPYRGVFEGNEGRDTGEGLRLRLNLHGGYDDNLLADQPGGSLTTGGVAGSFGSVAGGVDYLVRNGQGFFRAGGTSQVRVYQELQDLRGTSHSGEMGYAVPFGRYAVFSGAHTARLSPYYQFRLGPAPAPIEPGTFIDQPSPDRDITELDTLTHQTVLSMRHSGERARLRYHYGFGGTRFSGDRPDTRMHTGGVEFEQRMTRYATLRLGYALRTATHGLDVVREDRVHDLNLGGGYSRPLSFSRRTTVGFQGGTSRVSAETGGRWHLNLEGRAQHEIGRTWVLNATYQQGVQLLDLLPDPLLTKTVRFGLHGLATRRLDLALLGGYTHGQVRAPGGYDPFKSSDASARVRMALTRRLAFFTEYVLYQHEFARGLRVPTGLGSEINRHGLRAGVTAWIPVWAPRGDDAAR